MKNIGLSHWLSLVAIVTCGGFAGCNSESTQPSDTAPATSTDTIFMDELPPMLDDTGASDGHPTHGPHGGELIELGREDYHAEILHKPEGVIVFVLDGKAKSEVPIKSTQLTIALNHDGKVTTHELVAAPQETDTPGKTARFISEDKPFSDLLDDGAEGVITIPIAGRSYTGSVHHGHDHVHAGHDHGDHTH